MCLSVELGSGGTKVSMFSGSVERSMRPVDLPCTEMGGHVDVETERATSMQVRKQQHAHRGQAVKAVRLVNAKNVGVRGYGATS